MITKVFSDKHTIVQVKNAQLERVFSWDDVRRLIAKGINVDASDVIGLEADDNKIKIKFSPKTYQ